MKEETKKALKELEQATKAANSLCKMGHVDKSIDYDDETLDALVDAYEIEKQAKIKYHTLFFQERGLSPEQINDWLKRAGLK